ncbi:MAG TPA: 30S ribosomal protein S30 [Porticoccaceae bacterium]|nr:30S ribosomal protein S30 [Porticoccaceae bacterium]
MQKPLQISFLNLDHSAAVEERIREECAKLEQFYNGIIGCRVTLEAAHRRHHQGNIYEIKVHLTLPEGEIVISHPHHDQHAHEDIYVAIRDGFKAARRQLEDFSRKRRQQVKSHEPPQHGRVAKILPEEDYGFIETNEGRQIYFHRNSLINARLESLNPGDEMRFVEELGEQGPQASTVYLQGKHHYR